jgi:hypothetical protein
VEELVELGVDLHCLVLVALLSASALSFVPLFFGILWFCAKQETYGYPNKTADIPISMANRRMTVKGPNSRWPIAGRP